MEKRNYWMHRISNEGEAKKQLLEKGVLATSWGDYSTEDFINATLGVTRIGFSSIYPGKEHSRYCLYMFIHDFKKGDYVVVPESRSFSVYEITGERPIPKERIADYAKDVAIERLDIGVCWQVKSVEKDIKRSPYADNKLQRRLKFQMTDACLTDIADSVDDAISRKQQENPIMLRSLIIDQTVDIVLQRLKESVNDVKLEKVVKWYTEQIGATSAEIPAKNILGQDEGDADVIAKFEELQVRLLIQVKQHDNEVGKDAVKQIITASQTMVSEYTDVLWVISTCENYSEEAQFLASIDNVRLIDGREFAAMLLNVGIKNLSI